MKKQEYKDSKKNNNNSITYNFIILIISTISLFVESIITIISLFKKGIFKKDPYDNDSEKKYSPHDAVKDLSLIHI